MATTAVTTPDLASVLSGRVRQVIYAAWAVVSVAAGAASVYAGAAGLTLPWLAPTLTTLAWLGAACGLTAASHTPTAQAQPADTGAVLDAVRESQAAARVAGESYAAALPGTVPATAS